MRANRRRPRTESIWWPRPRRPRMRAKRPRRWSGRPRRSPRRHPRRSPRRAPWPPRRPHPWRTTPSGKPRRAPHPRRNRSPASGRPRDAAMRAEGRTGGRSVGTGVLLAAVLSAGPTVRLTAQDTSAVDRGVRIGILYRPGVRPGIVVLTGRAPGLDSLRTIMARDIDYSDRFELITLPGSDSIRLAAARPAAGTGTGKTGGGAAS